MRVTQLVRLVYRVHRLKVVGAPGVDPVRDATVGLADDVDTEGVARVVEFRVDPLKDLPHRETAPRHLQEYHHYGVPERPPPDPAEPLSVPV